MPVEVKVPQLSESIASGTLLAWRKQAGEKVQRDETLVDLETDKVILEVPSPVDGVLARIMQPEGATVTAGETLAIIETEASAAATPVSPVVPAAPKPAQEQAKSTKPAEPAPSPVTPVSNPPKSEVLPAKRLPDDGPHKQRLSVQSREGRETRVPMSRLRQRVAERLVAAQHTAAILTTFNEVNMQPVNELRQRFKAEFETRHGIKLGYMSFFVRAVCDALRQFPVVNASIDGEDIVYHDY